MKMPARIAASHLSSVTRFKDLAAVAICGGGYRRWQRTSAKAVEVNGSPENQKTVLC